MSLLNLLCTGCLGQYYYYFKVYDWTKSLTKIQPNKPKRTFKDETSTIRVNWIEVVECPKEEFELITSHDGMSKGQGLQK